MSFSTTGDFVCTNHADGASNLVDVFESNLTSADSVTFLPSESNAWTDGVTDWNTVYTKDGDLCELWVLTEENGTYKFYWYDFNESANPLASAGNTTTDIQVQWDGNDLQIAQDADPAPNTLNAYTRVRIT